MPFIDHYEPGKVVIDGKPYTQDVLILGDEVMTWFRVEFEALHEADLQFLLSEGAKEIIVGLGPSDERLVLPPDAKAALSHWPARIDYLGSAEAVAAFNAAAGSASLALVVRTDEPFDP